MIVFYLYIYSIFIITVKAVVGCYKINFISNHDSRGSFKPIGYQYFAFWHNC